MINKLLLALILFLSAAIAAAQEDVSQAMKLIREGKNDDAIIALNTIIEKSPGSSGAHMALGLAYLEKGSYPASRAELERSVALDPSAVSAHYTLALLYEKQKEFALGIEEWKIVQRLSTDKSLTDIAAKHINNLERYK